jgi:hypothetical protein
VRNGLERKSIEVPGIRVGISGEEYGDPAAVSAECARRRPCARRHAPKSQGARLQMAISSRTFPSFISPPAPLWVIRPRDITA